MTEVREAIHQHHNKSGVPLAGAGMEELYSTLVMSDREQLNTHYKARHGGLTAPSYMTRGEVIMRIMGVAFPLWVGSGERLKNTYGSVYSYNTRKAVVTIEAEKGYTPGALAGFAAERMDPIDDEEIEDYGDGYGVSEPLPVGTFDFQVRELKDDSYSLTLILCAERQRAVSHLKSIDSYFTEIPYPVVGKSEKELLSVSQTYKRHDTEDNPALIHVALNAAGGVIALQNLLTSIIDQI